MTADQTTLLKRIGGYRFELANVKKSRNGIDAGFNDKGQMCYGFEQLDQRLSLKLIAYCHKLKILHKNTYLSHNEIRLQLKILLLFV